MHAPHPRVVEHKALPQVPAFAAQDPAPRSSYRLLHQCHTAPANLLSWQLCTSCGSTQVGFEQRRPLNDSKNAQAHQNMLP
jgi:hypothetical protein